MRAPATSLKPFELHTVENRLEGILAKKLGYFCCPNPDRGPNGYRINSDNIRKAYDQVFAEAKKLGVNSLSTPSIGVGIGYAPLMSAVIGVKAAECFAQANVGARIKFVIRSEKEFGIYQSILVTSPHKDHIELVRGDYTQVKTDLMIVPI